MDVIVNKLYLPCDIKGVINSYCSVINLGIPVKI